jgi:hypothetical protein
MAYEKRDGDIAVFKERNKTNERGPDWSGDALIDGVTYRVAFWQKSTTMLSGKIEVSKKQPTDQSAGGGKAIDDDFEVPF